MLLSAVKGCVTVFPPPLEEQDTVVLRKSTVQAQPSLCLSGVLGLLCKSAVIGIYCYQNVPLKLTLFCSMDGLSESGG